MSYRRSSYNTKRSRSTYASRSRALSGKGKAAKRVEIKVLDSFGALNAVVPTTPVLGGIPSTAVQGVARFGAPGNATPVIAVGAGLNCAINNVSIGSAGYQREGRKINMRDVHLTYMINYPSGTLSATAVQSRIFVALVMDLQCNGGLPNTGTEIFTSGYLTADGASSQLQSLPQVNMNTANRFKVLAIKYHDPRPQTLVSAGTTYLMAPSKCGNLTAKLGVSTTFNSDIGTSPALVQVADIADTSIFFMCWTATLASTVAPVVTWCARLTYTG